MPDIVIRIGGEYPRAIYDPNGPGGEVINTPLEHRMLWWVRGQLSGAPEYLQRISGVLNTYLRENCQHHWREYRECCTPPKHDCDPPHRQCLWCQSVEELSTEHAEEVGEVLTPEALSEIVGGAEDYLPEDDYFPLCWQNANLNDVSASAADLVYLARLSSDFVAEMLASYGSYFAAVRDIAETQWVGKRYVNPQDQRVIAIVSRVMFFPNGATTVMSIATPQRIGTEAERMHK